MEIQHKVDVAHTLESKQVLNASSAVFFENDWRNSSSVNWGKE